MEMVQGKEGAEKPAKDGDQPVAGGEADAPRLLPHVPYWQRIGGWRAAAAT